MPILTKEPDLYPDDLLRRDDWGFDAELRWWVVYTRSRREKDLMRRLLQLEIPFYSPVIARRTKSPQGRVRTSHVPLFKNYVFLYGDHEQRYEAMTTNCVSNCIEVSETERFVTELSRIRALIATGAEIAPESQIEDGQYVRVRTGPFRGFEGIVIRRERTARLLVYVNFLQQGASVTLDECELERI